MKRLLYQIKPLITAFKPILEISIIYRLYQHIIGDNAFRKLYSEKYVKPNTNNKILDIGCGPANMLDFLPDDIYYYGFDISPKYIEFAAKKYNNPNFKFVTSDLTDICIKENGFDIAMANAVLMNLSDKDADVLFKTAYNSLKQGGRLVIYDGYYENNLNFIKKFLVTNERGRFIRTKKTYYKLASKHFNDVHISACDNMYKIPYPMIIIECRK